MQHSATRQLTEQKWIKWLFQVEVSKNNRLYKCSQLSLFFWYKNRSLNFAHFTNKCTWQKRRLWGKIWFRIISIDVYSNCVFGVLSFSGVQFPGNCRSTSYNIVFIMNILGWKAEVTNYRSCSLSLLSRSYTYIFPENLLLFIFVRGINLISGISSSLYI